MNAQDPDVDTLQALRQRVLSTSLNILAVAMPFISALMLIRAAYTSSLTGQIVWSGGAMLVFPLLRLFSSRLGFSRSAVLLVAFLALSGFLLSSRGGLTVGYAAVCVLTIQLATLFFRRRGAALAIAAIALLHVVAWILVMNRLNPSLTPELWDPSSNVVWGRTLVIMSALGLVIALGELYVIEQLAQSLAIHRELAEREKAQRLALEEAERVQAHERDQRAQAQAALERSRRIEALARVAGGVAHDFNNALTVILGAAEAAREPSQSREDIDAHMDAIVDSAHHAAALTNQLLTLGRQRLSTPARASLTRLLTRIRPAFVRLLPDDILLTVDMPTDDITVRADETGMDRALLNLVLNARDAMPKGGTITISGHREHAPANDLRLPSGTYAVIRVTDDGLGMDQETLDRIFDPFFTTKGDKGTGLGLASVYAFAQECQGAVDVVSAPGRGTTLTIWLPEAAPAEPAAPPEAAAPAEAPRPRTGRVLVVEDLAEVRAMMTRALSQRGFDVIQASNGDEALAIIERGVPVALMCIDGIMPGLSTATTIERARTVAPEMGVIVCSGHVQEELLRRGIETGRYELLQKPFSPQELAARISRALERSPAADS